MVHRILVALDDSAPSKRAAIFVNEFFQEMDAEIFAMNVAEIPLSWYPAIGDGVVTPYASPLLEPPDVDETADRASERARDVITGSGIDSDETITEIGDPVEAIERATVEYAIELVVVGATERGWWSRLVDPSVTEQILRSRGIPVLVVP